MTTILSALLGRAQSFDASPGSDGKIRTSVWDRFCTVGQKVKEGEESVFDGETLGQMVTNWYARGGRLAMCQDHKSAATPYVSAPALAFYDGMAVVVDGKVVLFKSLVDSTATEPDVEALRAIAQRFATEENPNPSPDGLWGWRCEITPLGEDAKEGLRNYRGISPMFVTDGTDEQDKPIGYVLFDVAATNTAFQSSCEITFSRGVAGAPAVAVRIAQRGANGMSGLPLLARDQQQAYEEWLREKGGRDSDQSLAHWISDVQTAWPELSRGVNRAPSYSATPRLARTMKVAASNARSAITMAELETDHAPKYAPGDRVWVPGEANPITIIERLGEADTGERRGGKWVKDWLYRVQDAKGREQRMWLSLPRRGIAMAYQGDKQRCPHCGSTDTEIDARDSGGWEEDGHCNGCGGEFHVSHTSSNDQGTVTKMARHRAMAVGDVACPLCEGTGSEKVGVGGRATRCRACSGERTVPAERADRIRKDFNLDPAPTIHARKFGTTIAAPPARRPSVDERGRPVVYRPIGYGTATATAIAPGSLREGDELSFPRRGVTAQVMWVDGDTVAIQWGGSGIKSETTIAKLVAQGAQKMCARGARMMSAIDWHRIRTSTGPDDGSVLRDKVGEAWIVEAVHGDQVSLWDARVGGGTHKTLPKSAVETDFQVEVYAQADRRSRVLKRPFDVRARRAPWFKSAPEQHRGLEHGTPSAATVDEAQNRLGHPIRSRSFSAAASGQGVMTMQKILQKLGIAAGAPLAERMARYSAYAFAASSEDAAAMAADLDESGDPDAAAMASKLRRFVDEADGDDSCSTGMAALARKLGVTDGSPDQIHEALGRFAGAVKTKFAEALDDPAQLASVMSEVDGVLEHAGAENMDAYAPHFEGLRRMAEKMRRVTGETPADAATMAEDPEGDAIIHAFARKRGLDPRRTPRSVILGAMAAEGADQSTIDSRVQAALAAEKLRTDRLATNKRAEELFAIATKCGFSAEAKAGFMTMARGSVTDAETFVSSLPGAKALTRITSAGAPIGATAGATPQPGLRPGAEETRVNVELAERAQLLVEKAKTDPQTMSRLSKIAGPNSHPGMLLAAAQKIVSDEAPEIVEWAQPSSAPLFGLV